MTDEPQLELSPVVVNNNSGHEGIDWEDFNTVPEDWQLNDMKG